MAGRVHAPSGAIFTQVHARRTPGFDPEINDPLAAQPFGVGPLAVVVDREQKENYVLVPFRGVDQWSGQCSKRLSRLRP
jgi:hypothetical protein